MRFPWHLRHDHLLTQPLLMNNLHRNQTPQLKQALLDQSAVYYRAFAISLFTGLLSFTPTLYMMQIYDRVVNSRSLVTLQMLLLLVVGIYAVMEVLHWARAEMMRQAAEKMDARLNERLFDAIFTAHIYKHKVSGNQIFSDLSTLREFFVSPVVFAVMESPMALVFLVVIFWINPMLGAFALTGALVQFLLALLTEKKVHPPLQEAGKASIAAQVYAASGARNAPVIESMGMIQGIHARWLKLQRRALQLQAVASDSAGGLSATAKSVQLIQSSALLGLACWFAIVGELQGGGGMMIVASILGGMVLKPLVQTVSGWKQVITVRDAYERLNRLLTHIPPRAEQMSLPAPLGHLQVSAVTAGAPSLGEAASTPILRNVSFALKAGECLAVIGPSGSGKSTLAKLLIGVWPTRQGKVRLDGADVFAWSKSELGPFLGYLPQEIELFDGTLAENIARFGEVNMHKVRVAAELAGLDNLVQALPQGYDTPIGEEGAFLSGGQRQRVGLARAVYGQPRLVVLDEPNASLDEEGEVVLLELLGKLKSRGVTVVVITHRSNVLAPVDRLLLLVEGTVQAFGPRDEVLTKINAARQAGNPHFGASGTVAQNNESSRSLS